MNENIYYRMNLSRFYVDVYILLLNFYNPYIKVTLQLCHFILLAYIFTSLFINDVLRSLDQTPKNLKDN